MPLTPKISYSGINKTTIKLGTPALAWAYLGNDYPSIVPGGLAASTLPVGCSNTTLFETGGKQSSIKIDCPGGNLSAALSSFTYYNSSAACLGTGQTLSFGASDPSLPSVINSITSKTNFKCFSGKAIVVFRYGSSDCSTDLLTHPNAAYFIPTGVCMDGYKWVTYPNGTYQQRYHNDGVCANAGTVYSEGALGVCIDSYIGSGTREAWAEVVFASASVSVVSAASSLVVAIVAFFA